MGQMSWRKRGCFLTKLRGTLNLQQDEQYPGREGLVLLKMRACLVWGRRDPGARKLAR